MRKIRIGNDIRLKLEIKPNTQAGFDKIDEFDQSSVKQLKCYLINTCHGGCHDDEPKLKPFLRVGFPEFYNPTHNNINNAGFSSYHMRPANLCNYERFEPDFHDFHWWPGYRGFGLHPEHFHDWCCHMHHGPRPKPSCCGFEPWVDCCHHHCEPHVPACAEPYHPLSEPYDIYGPAEDHRHPDPCCPCYLADSQVLNEKNTLTCMFPAVQLRFCGIYKLIVVLTVFEQGWGRHNLRTYTIDKGNVFELVCDESGESGAITIDMDDSGKRVDLIDSIYTEHNNYRMVTNSIMAVNEYDMDDKQYNIYVTLNDGSQVLYDPYDWRYNKLEFVSGDPDALTIDKDGTIHTHDIEGIEYTVPVTIKNADGDDTGEFNVTIVAAETFKMGFSDKDDHLEVSPNDSFLHDYKIKDGVYTVLNPTTGKYLWILTKRKIKYIHSVYNETEDIAVQLSSGIRVPLTDYVIRQGYFCYRSVAPIQQDSMRTKIKFA